MSIVFRHGAVFEVVISCGEIELLPTEEKLANLTNYLKLTRNHSNVRYMEYVFALDDLAFRVNLSSKGCYLSIINNDHGYYNINLTNIDIFNMDFKEYFISEGKLDPDKVKELLLKLHHIYRALLLKDELFNTLSDINHLVDNVSCS